jgi:hypothetical protein
MGHRNLTMLIRHYWRWINPGELSQAPLARLGAVKNSSNQPQPDPTRANQGVSRGLTTMLKAKKWSKLAEQDGFEPAVPLA